MIRKNFATGVLKKILVFTAYRLRVITKSPIVGDDPETDSLVETIVSEIYSVDQIDDCKFENHKQEQLYGLLKNDDEIIESHGIYRQIYRCLNRSSKQPQRSERLSQTNKKITYYRLLCFYYVYSPQPRFWRGHHH